MPVMPNRREDGTAALARSGLARLALVNLHVLSSREHFEVGDVAEVQPTDTGEERADGESAHGRRPVPFGG